MDTFISSAGAQIQQVSGAGEIDADTHGLTVQGALAVTAIDTTLGTITLPANGPWTIFGVWSMVVNATNTAAQAIAGYMRLESVNGDVTPNPAPSKFPFPTLGSYLGATANVAKCPLKIWPVRYEAPGKAQLNMIFRQHTVNTVAPQAVGGIIFGKTIPLDEPMLYVDHVRVASNVATIAAIGTITLAEKASRIHGICGMLYQDGTLTTAEEVIGRFLLSSDDIKMPPSEYPFSAAYGAGLGALIGNGDSAIPQFIPVIIPVIGGARIDAFLDLNTATTNNVGADIYIAYH